MKNCVNCDKEIYERNPLECEVDNNGKVCHAVVCSQNCLEEHQTECHSK